MCDCLTYGSLFGITYFYIHDKIVQPIDWFIMRKQQKEVDKERQVLALEHFADEAELRELDHHPVSLGLLFYERADRGHKVGLGDHVILEL